MPQSGTAVLTMAIGVRVIGDLYGVRLGARGGVVVRGVGVRASGRALLLLGSPPAALHAVLCAAVTIGVR